MYNYVLSADKENRLNLANDRMWAFAKTFEGKITDIDTADELSKAMFKFKEGMAYAGESLAKGELPVKGETYLVESANNGQIFGIEHFNKDVYRVLKLAPERNQYIGNGWLDKKDWSLKAVKKFLGYK